MSVISSPLACCRAFGELGSSSLVTCVAAGAWCPKGCCRASHTVVRTVQLPIGVENAGRCRWASSN
eukprot:1160718-Pelagomonas_calceolata.AAC.1